MNNSENICLCALNNIFGYEPGIALLLLENLGSATAVFAMDDDARDRLLGPYSRYRGRLCQREIDNACHILERAAACGARFVGITSPEYPSRLRQCPDAPPGIFVRSADSLSSIFSTSHFVSVVGTRDITPYGETLCRELVRKLACAGQPPCIVSGLALGVDIAAHTEAVECGIPTIAVMATGPDDVYPRRHRSFADKLCRQPSSALVTDFPPGTAPVALNFIRRNRIIAGLSDCVILVESAVKGGGMVTCRQAFSYDRTVYVLPGRLGDRHSEGCNLLVREGVAEIIDSLDDLPLRIGLGKCRAAGKGRRPEEFYAGRLSAERLEMVGRILKAVGEAAGITAEEMAGLCG
ncbi:MAG: DNA-processing protein DprA, partial [Candidatus Cryptobacteroides sp.]